MIKFKMLIKYIKYKVKLSLGKFVNELVGKLNTVVGNEKPSIFCIWTFQIHLPHCYCHSVTMSFLFIIH